MISNSVPQELDPLLNLTSEVMWKLSSIKALEPRKMNEATLIRLNVPLLIVIPEREVDGSL